MNKLTALLSLSILLGITSCSNETVQTLEKTNPEAIVESNFKLYPTSNMWTFLKLDSRNGMIWQVQYSIEGDEYRFEKPLNTGILTNKPQSDRFELYPTQNIYNFILLDKINGDTWQVQWSSKAENQAIIPIRSLTNAQ